MHGAAPQIPQPPMLCWGGSFGAGRVGGGAGGPATQQHSLPYLLLALGAPPHALGRGLEGRVQAAEVVGPWAGATRLQVGPSLAGSTELVMGNLTLEEKGGQEAGRWGWERAGGAPGSCRPDLLGTQCFSAAQGERRAQELGGQVAARHVDSRAPPGPQPLSQSQTGCGTPAP